MDVLLVFHFSFDEPLLEQEQLLTIINIID